MSLQLGHYSAVRLVPHGIKLRDALKNSVKLFAAGHVRFIFAVVRVHKGAVIKRAYAYHKELVQIRLKYRRKHEPFAEGDVFVHRLLKDSFVEFKP